MSDDPILANLYHFREELAAQFHYDVYALVAYLQEKQAKENRPVVSFSAKRVEMKPEEIWPEQQAA
jgi:hypothetical protein